MAKKTTKKKETKSKAKKVEIKAKLISERVIAEASDQARELYNQGRYGTVLENGDIQLNLIEALFEEEGIPVRRPRPAAKTGERSNERNTPHTER